MRSRANQPALRHGPLLAVDDSTSASAVIGSIALLDNLAIVDTAKFQSQCRSRDEKSRRGQSISRGRTYSAFVFSSTRRRTACGVRVWQQ
jgi:hypothetical protein